MVMQPGKSSSPRQFAGTAVRACRRLFSRVLSEDLLLLPKTRRALMPLKNIDFNNVEHQPLPPALLPNISFQAAMRARATPKQIYSAAMQNPSLSIRSEGYSPLLLEMLKNAFQLFLETNSDSKFISTADFAFKQQPNFKQPLFLDFLGAIYYSKHRDKTVVAAHALWLHLPSHMDEILGICTKSNLKKTSHLLARTKDEILQASQRWRSGIG